MALMEIVQSITLEAGGDLSADQWKFVTLAADGQIDVHAAATDMPTGVLLNNPAAAGQAAEVAVEGIVKVEASAAITVGANVTTTAAGLAATAVATDSIVGIAMSTAGVAGVLVEVLFGYRGAAV